MPTSDVAAAPPPPTDETSPSGGDGPRPEPVTFDFAASGRLTRQRARLIQVALDQVARDATDVVRLWVDGLRIEAGDVEQRTVSDLLAGVVDHAPLTIPERAEHGLVITELGLARSLVLTLLGGQADAQGQARPLTSIETEVLDLVLIRLIDCLARVLGLGSVQIGVHQTNPDAATNLDGRELMLGIPFQLTTQQFTGRVWIVLSAAAMQAFTAEHERHLPTHPSTQRPVDRRRTEALLQGVTVPVVCGFPAVRVPARELAFLQPGDVLRTGHPTSRSLLVTVGGSPLYGARAGNRGLRLVTEIVSAQAPTNRPLPGGTS